MRNLYIAVALLKLVYFFWDATSAHDMQICTNANCGDCAKEDHCKRIGCKWDKKRRGRHVSKTSKKKSPKGGPGGICTFPCTMDTCDKVQCEQEESCVEGGCAWDESQSTCLPPRTRVHLTQSDFAEGTYRITEPGIYILDGDIEFAPQPMNDYWPPMDQWHKYPPAAFYLGFFAAITIESDNVEIDLNNFAISQSREFYLLQRFYNNIELNNRVFVANEGVSSLNYQKTDRPVEGPPAGGLITPKNVVIKNGKLGRASHAGIHGNSIEGLKIENVHIYDFEVAGVQCNGCKHVSIKQTEVGPSAQNVPTLATFSHSRFFEFFSERLIPNGFATEPKSDDLFKIFNDTITFADRPDAPVTLGEVFMRNSNAVKLFQKYHMGRIDKNSLSSDDVSLLEEAKKVFGNRLKLPDGSVVYGILLNRRGLPATDDNFNGAGRESKHIEISDVKIHGLSANPIEVPSLMTDAGSHIQGPARDLLRIYDITTDRLRTILDSRYKGNFLSDMYFAMWQMSNKFYRIRVFDSDCGNFGSNASMPLNLYSFPSGDAPTCADLGSTTDPSLTGRKVTMLQKRYFGGLQMTQVVYDWATTTPALGLDGVLSRPSRHDLQRSGYRHSIVCDHDTMFHPMHGVVALKMVELSDSNITRVDIYNLTNTADKQIWTCGRDQPWQMQPSGEDIQARTPVTALKSQQAAMVRGVELVRCSSIDFTDMSVKNLTSHEGASIGVEVIGDSNDRSDHNDDDGITYNGVNIHHLSGPGPNFGFKNVATPIEAPSGITVGPLEEIDASLGTPRIIMNYQMTNARIPRSAGEKFPVLAFTNDQVLVDLKRTTTFNTDEKIRNHRKRVLSFYRQHYGIVFADDVDKTPLLDPITVYARDGTPTDSIVLLGKLAHDARYHATEICISDGDSNNGHCNGGFIGLVHDFSFNFLPGESGYTFHGAFGGDAGKFCPQYNVIPVGVYSFENVNFQDVNENANLQVEYYGECPTPVVKFHGDMVGFYINCPVESDIFGKGMATGGYIFHPSADGTEWILNGYPSMIFDDVVTAPETSPVYTRFFDEDWPQIENNDWRFSFIADGTFDTRMGGTEAVVYGHMHHFTHEAGLYFLKLRTSYNTDERIFNLRKKFLTRLRDKFGITLNPDSFDDVPLDGVIDLGGTNHIMAYVVNEQANQRVLTKRNTEEAIVMPNGSRLHEGGFRFVVGRAGIMTEKGRIPFGSIFQEGVYYLEDSTIPEKGWEINFHSEGPAILNGWASAVVYHALHHPVLGDGRMYAFFPFPFSKEDGITLSGRGVMVFGNIDVDGHL